ncbi:hypothetical protein M911_05695 [Ectothiorhodospira haloalkaliphila]|uniref:ATP-grasp domain-containing protein n=1 Tax=Ectothiorhodospira haloalkaliphila TaxID=421628 RepID=W8KT52_9GAMM|nr:hypothetical protein M911_05695 [Ectothiorhodospira haloalkaliphila]
MPDHPTPSAPATAVVAGLCAHGLAVVRSLGRAGVPVVALEARRELPGYRTRVAKVIHTPDINGIGLIDALQTLRNQLPATPEPVLFLTNDNMVRVVARHWEDIDGLYRLSWGHCRDSILSLLDKASLEAHCRENDLPYPRTWTFHSQDNPHHVSLNNLEAQGLTFPLIVKPTQPLSGFKVRLVRSRNELVELVNSYPNALPFLLQHWIQGGDRRILFVALYLDQGRILARFTGRKLASQPPAMGQTTVAESYQHERMEALAEEFFKPLRLSGPVSLEAKLDDHGNPWIIEPTLGRTDYWLDCCTANGVNLPWVEYQSQCGLPGTTPRQTAGTIWFDTESSPASYLRLRWLGGETATARWNARFAYWDRRDPAPSVWAMWRFLKWFISRAWAKAIQVIRRGRPLRAQP